jgi:hypothetical protein
LHNVQQAGCQEGIRAGQLSQQHGRQLGLHRRAWKGLELSLVTRNRESRKEKVQTCEAWSRHRKRVEQSEANAQVYHRHCAIMHSSQRPRKNEYHLRGE